MITFGPMTLLAVPRPALARRPIRRFAPLLAALLLPAALRAQQTSLTHTEDAAPIPQGMLRVRVTTGWARYDQRFTQGNGLVPLGNDLSTDSLGPRQLPRLTPLEMGLQTLSGNPAARLTLGRLEVRSEARIMTMPIALEYGLTRRLSVGVMVPVVQTRQIVTVAVNRDSAARANMGYLLASERTDAAKANEAVRAAYQAAADNLKTLIARCATTPSGAGCTNVNASPSDAAAVAELARQFADAASAFGTSAITVRLAPRGTSALKDSIQAHQNALNARLANYLGAGAGAQTSIFFSGADFAYLDLQGGHGLPGLLQSEFGGGLDSLHTIERLGIGDIEIGAQFLVFDGFAHDALTRPALQSRLMIGGSVRFATSRADSAQSLNDIPNGEGAGYELRSAFDLVTGHFGGTAAARYMKYLPRTVTAAVTGDPESPGWPTATSFGQRRRTSGDVVAVDVTPRFLFGESMALEGQLGIERVAGAKYDDATIYFGGGCIDVCSATISTPAGPTRTARRLGVGLRYSTVDAYARGQARYPVEVSLRHLETTNGDPGVPKLARDEIQMRLYFRLLGR